MLMRPLLRGLRRFRQDHRGVSAVEFALIAPIMILFYFGMAEYCQALMAQRRANSSASAVGDLIAQANGQIAATGSGSIDDVFDITDIIMKPFATGTAMKICVASIVADASNVKRVEWRRSQNDTTCPAVGTVITTVPTELIAANQSVIMSRVTYTYSSSTSQALKTTPVFTKTLYLRPRRSSKITCNGCS